MKASLALCALSLTPCAVGAPLVLPFEHTPPKSTIIPTSSVPEDMRQHLPAKVAIIDDSDAQDVLGVARPDNRPFSPSTNLPPSEILATPRPLSTKYLLSLHPSSNAKEAIPHAQIVDSSIVREETGTAVQTQLSIVELETEGNKPVYHKIPCSIHAGHFHLVRRYADTKVVSIGLIFIAAIAIMELWGPVRRLIQKSWRREGEIRLGETADQKAQSRPHYSDLTPKSPTESDASSSLTEIKPTLS